MVSGAALFLGRASINALRPASDNTADRPGLPKRVKPCAATVDDFAEQLGAKCRRKPQRVIQAIKGNCLFHINNHDAIPTERAGQTGRVPLRWAGRPLRNQSNQRTKICRRYKDLTGSS